MFSKPTKVVITASSYEEARRRINGMYPSNKYHVEAGRPDIEHNRFTYYITPRGEFKTRSRHTYV